MPSLIILHNYLVDGILSQIPGRLPELLFRWGTAKLVLIPILQKEPARLGEESLKAQILTRFGRIAAAFRRAPFSAGITTMEQDTCKSMPQLLPPLLKYLSAFLICRIIL